MKKFLTSAAALVLLITVAWTYQTPPAAVVVKVDGNVQVIPSGGEASPAAVGTRLSVGDQIVPDAGARAVVVSRTGATRAITEAVTIQEASDSEGGDMFSRTVQVLAQAANTNARNQPNRQGMIRPIPGQPVQVAPRLGLAVASVRPTFTWRGVESTDGYILQIRKEGSPPLRFETGDATEWSLPEGEDALEPGAMYFWTVAPKGQGRAPREQTFRVAAEETLSQVEEQLSVLREAELDPAGDGAFMAAVMYRDAELFYDAARALDLLEASGAPMSREAWFLKGEVLDAVGRLDEAKEAFDKGDAMGG